MILKIKILVINFFLATATNWNYDKTKDAYNFLTNSLEVIMSYEKIKSYSYEKYDNDNNKELEKFALDFLKKTDFNICGYKVYLENKDECDTNNSSICEYYIPYMPIYNIKTKHIIDNNLYEFDILEESLGTQVIFSFCY